MSTFCPQLSDEREVPTWLRVEKVPTDYELKLTTSRRFYRGWPLSYRGSFDVGNLTCTLHWQCSVQASCCQKGLVQKCSGILWMHYAIQQQVLIVNTLQQEMNNVLEVTERLRYFIRGRTVNHCLFNELCSEVRVAFFSSTHRYGGHDRARKYISSSQSAKNHNRFQWQAANWLHQNDHKEIYDANFFIWLTILRNEWLTLLYFNKTASAPLAW